MRTLALDVGTKTIGVAVSDELGISARGVTTIKRKQMSKDIDALSRIIDEYNPSEIVIGVPFNVDGTVGRRGRDILDFADSLRSAFSVQVRLWDESYSTADAEKVLLEANLSRRKRKRVIDKMAAVVILQDYLNSKESSENSVGLTKSE